jgi:hypothetical protein
MNDANVLKRFIVPVNGLRVINPATGQPLPTEGAEVVGNAEYWLRRQNDGDVTEGKPIKPTAPKRQEQQP